MNASSFGVIAKSYKPTQVSAAALSINITPLIVSVVFLIYPLILAYFIQ